MSNIKDFWEICPENYAHISANTSRCNFIEYFKNIELSNLSVADYGIGGGYLGKYLFDEKNIKKYVGLDIAERSIIKATEILANYKEVELHLLPFDFKKLNVDIFVSISCIQHFPDQKYLDNFLIELNESGIEMLVLQIRFGEKTKFLDHAYKIPSDVSKSCVTNLHYMSTLLTKYYLFKELEIDKHNNQCLQFKKKEI